MSKRLCLGLIFLLLAEVLMATEEPEYTIVDQSGVFELRTYDSMIIAETTISGSMDKASRTGFRVIADYIFGNNTSPTGGSEKVSMTAPVTMKQIDGQWRMHFVMPKKHSLESLPSPNNSAIVLREIPEQNYAAIRFSGSTSDARVAKKTTELMAWLASKGISPIGTPEIARYNPPWILPLFRRNEILVKF